jgi:hypothetical protein
MFLAVENATQWRGSPDTSRRRLARLLALSLVLHAPLLTPIAALAGLFGLLQRAPTEEAPPADPITAIPVDLVSDERPSATSEPAPAQAEKPAAPADDPFADLDRAGDDSAPAIDEPTPVVNKPVKDAGADSGAIGDPVAMAGSAGKVVDANANVRLLIFADRIRNHQLGQRIGALLGAAQQWRDFFGPTGLDPIQDVDRILIAGPQLRDSSEVVAVLRVNVSDDRLKQAVSALVRRSDGGEWLDGGVPVAKAKADRAERVFVLPAPHILVVAPPSAQAHALSLGPGLKFPSPQGSEALTTYVVSPWRAFTGIPFQVPKSIQWVRMKIVPSSDGGATAELVAEDESAESAKKDAEALDLALKTVTQHDLGDKGVLGKLASWAIGSNKIKLVESVSFTASGKEIHGTVVATNGQLGALLEAISNYAKELQEQAEKNAKAAAADGGADGATSKPDAWASKPDAAPENAAKYGSDGG